MTFEIPRLVPSTPDEFIGFWSEQYFYKHEHLYENNIGEPLTKKRVLALYEWKNGGAIAAKKIKSIKLAYITELGAIPNLEDQEKAKAYALELKGGPIWNIFWLHCIAPNLFPIFDQHTFRAMCKMRNGVVAEIPTKNHEVIATYFKSYIPFAQELPMSQRIKDRALFAYGRFLKNGYSKK